MKNISIRTLVALMLGFAVSALPGCSLNTSGNFYPGDDSLVEPDPVDLDLAVDHAEDPGPDGAPDSPDLPPDAADILPDPDAPEEPECTHSSQCDDANACNGLETCDPLHGVCVPGVAPAEGTPCAETPRSICLGGTCVESVCGDCFTDRGAGEFCDDCNDDPGDGCHLCLVTCTGPADCDDGDLCNGVETCNVLTGDCVNGTPAADGSVCLASPRRICLSGICVESICGDGYVDSAMGEQCEGSGESVCTTTCGTSGTLSCFDCAWGACVPPPEACNGTDDDCDGFCDETFDCCAGSAGSCPTSCGSTGSRTCSASCAWGPCNTLPETCNGEDDDCDGTCDEGFTCCAGITRPLVFAHCTFTEICTDACAWRTDWGTPPANDLCSGAISLACPGTASGSTCSAANDYQPRLCGGACTASSPYARDVAYRITVPGGQTWDVTIDTFGSELDSILYLRRNNCDSLNEMACNDDAASTVNSRITATLTAGTYYVIVDSCYTDPIINDLGSFTITCSR